jgi:glucose/mannose transport system permease protein
MQVSRPARRFTVDRALALLVLAPSVAAIAVFVYGFIAWSAYVSLSDWSGIIAQRLRLIGLQNYLSIFNQGRFQTDIRNTVVFTVLFVLCTLVLGLVLALMVDARVKGEAIYRTIYLFPMSLSFIVTGVAMAWIFTPGSNWQNGDSTGLNLLLQNWGLESLRGGWITDSTIWPNGGWFPAWSKTRLGVPLAMLPVVAAATWQMSGFTMAMYLAGLRAIPDEIREAARVDGASDWQLFRSIILPSLRPVTLSAIIVLGHVSLKIFDLIVTMTGGGPGNATDVPGLFMYEITFKANKVAEGAAVAMVILFVIALVIVPYLVSNMRNQDEG